MGIAVCKVSGDLVSVVEESDQWFDIQLKTKWMIKQYIDGCYWIVYTVEKLLSFTWIKGYIQQEKSNWVVWGS